MSSINKIHSNSNRSTALSRARTSLFGSNEVSPSDPTVGMTAKQKHTYLLKKRADDARIQQLRGVFAAFNEAQNDILSEKELHNALLSLGFFPNNKVIEQQREASPSGLVDLPTFIRICMALSGANSGISGPAYEDTTEDLIVNVFKKLDSDNTGRVPLSTLLHVLAEVDVSTRLSVEEVQELLKMSGILNESTIKNPRTLYSMEIDYRAFIRFMMFAPSAPSTASNK